MAVGSVNVPGALGLELREADRALEARIASAEKTLSGMEKIPGSVPPTSQVTAKVGQIYINVVTGEQWKCVAVNSGSSVWEKLTGTGTALSAADVGAVPVGRKINNKPLSADITLSAADVGAAAVGHTHTPASIGAAAASHGTHVSYSSTAPKMDGTAAAGTASTVARSDHVHPTDTSRAAASHTHTAAQVGAKSSDWKPFYAGTSAPSDKTQLWIDTTANTGGLKYWNGSAWTHVPVAYT